MVSQPRLGWLIDIGTRGETSRPVTGTSHESTHTGGRCLVAELAWRLIVKPGCNRKKHDEGCFRQDELAIVEWSSSSLLRFQAMPTPPSVVWCQCCEHGCVPSPLENNGQQPCRPISAISNATSRKPVKSTLDVRGALAKFSASYKETMGPNGPSTHATNWAATRRVTCGHSHRSRHAIIRLDGENGGQAWIKSKQRH